MKYNVAKKKFEENDMQWQVVKKKRLAIINLR